mgnify:CR=1 FL=1
MSEVDLPECGVARFLLLFDGPWATLIVRELMQFHGDISSMVPPCAERALKEKFSC